MNAHAAQILSDPEEAAEAEPLAFLRSKTFLGAMKRGVRPGITAAMLLEEGAYLAEQKFRKTGLAAAGAIAAEGLWSWQLDQERREREGGPAR